MKPEPRLAKKTYRTAQIPGQTFEGWETDLGITQVFVVFENAEARRISQAFVLANRRQHQAFYKDQDDTFMFKGTWQHRSAWLGWSGFLYAGLGETVVYAIGDGAWSWEEA